MALVPFNEMMQDAEARSYAIGYFETWDTWSMLGVIRAAEAARSPVIVGYSGIYLPRALDHERRWFEAYARSGRAAAEAAEVPVTYLFNESPHLDWVKDAARFGFNLVMFSDESLPHDERVSTISSLAEGAHERGIAVEAEMGEPPDAPHARGSDFSMTDPDRAGEFVRKTGVDALGVVVGNRHTPLGEGVELDTDLIAAIKDRAGVPLVLHAGSSVDPASMREAVKAGIRKVNIGRAVKEAAFASIYERTVRTGSRYPGYEVLGAGGDADLAGGMGTAIGEQIRRLMELYGSAGKAG
jgi:fructose-bisphosphate aldolase class II